MRAGSSKSKVQGTVTAKRQRRRRESKTLKTRKALMVTPAMRQKHIAQPNTCADCRAKSQKDKAETRCRTHAKPAKSTRRKPRTQRQGKSITTRKGQADRTGRHHQSEPSWRACFGAGRRLTGRIPSSRLRSLQQLAKGRGDFLESCINFAFDTNLPLLKLVEALLKLCNAMRLGSEGGGCRERRASGRRIVG